jgi:hypothetical protein
MRGILEEEDGKLVPVMAVMVRNSCSYICALWSSVNQLEIFLEARKW